MSRNQMRLMANEFRAKYGSGFLVTRASALMHEEGVDCAVIESIRSLGEAEEIKKLNGILLAVDADLELRFERVQARRSESDQVDFETFVKQEELEKNDPDPNGMQKAAVMEMADYTITNNGTVGELYQQVEKFLKQVDAKN